MSPQPIKINVNKLIVSNRIKTEKRKTGACGALFITSIRLFLK